MKKYTLLFLLVLVKAYPLYTKDSCKGRCTPGIPAHSLLISENNFLVYADSVFYNRFQKTWSFSGNVTAKSSKQHLKADKLVYHEQTQLLIATGSVTLQEKGQECLSASYVEISGNFKNLLLKNLQFVTSDHARFASNRAYVYPDKSMKLEKAVYTPCASCKGEKRQPIWQIKANQIVHSPEDKTTKFLDPHIEAWGAPFFYIPYLKLSSVRSSGFLTPEYGRSSTFGLYGGFPYLIAFEHADLKVIPYILQDRGGLAGVHFNQKGMESSLEAIGTLHFSKTAYYTENGKQKELHYPRGHATLDYRQDINDHWRLLLNGGFSSDTTYLRSVEELSLPGDIYSVPFLESNAQLERFSERDYLDLSTTAYQGFYDTSFGKKTIPFVLPSLTYHTLSLPLPDHSRLHFLGHSSVIRNAQNRDYKRLILQAMWEKNWINSWGQDLTAYLSFRGDAYRTDWNSIESKGTEKSSTDFRMLPQAILEARWPLELSFSPIVVSPVVQVVLAPFLKEKPAIPVGDSQGFEYTDAVLLRKNRSPGYDQLDSGSRIAYGSLFTVKQLSLFRLFVGQTFTPQEPNGIIKESGIRKGFSNIVGSFMAEPVSWFSFDYQFNIDQRTYVAQTSEVSGHLGTDTLRLSIGYIRSDPISKTAQLHEEKELIEGSLSSHFHRCWGGKISGNYNLSDHRPLRFDVHLIYQNDCLEASIQGGYSYYENKDIQPGPSFSFSIGFKNLGSLPLGSDSLKTDFSSISSKLKTVHHPVITYAKTTKQKENKSTPSSQNTPLPPQS